MLKVKDGISTNASTATKLQTARTIALSGSVTGSGNFDGSGNLTISTTTNHTHNYAGSSSAGGAANSATKLATARKINGVAFDGSADVTIADNTKFPIFVHSNVIDFNNVKTTGFYSCLNSGMTNAPTTNHGTLIVDFNVGTPYQIWIPDSSHAIYKRVYTTSSSTWGGWTTTLGNHITGNSGTATALQTARTINGTSFNGSANITTANWGTARTLTIGSTGKSVNGSANVSWTLAEIGAAASSHTHNAIVSRGAVTAESGVAARPAVAGLSMTQAYNNGYPTSYGNVISLRGSGDGQILVGWSGSDGGHAPVYVRSKRDNTTTANWSGWAQFYTSAHPQTTISGNAGTATKLQTARTINGVSFDGSANITITAAANGGTSAACSGNSATATKLATARTISLTGSVTGSGTFDGSGNLSIATTTNHTHSYLPLSGGVLTGPLTLPLKGSTLCGSGITTGNTQIVGTAATTIYFGNPSTGVIIESSKTPTVSVAGTSYTMYHTGNKPTAADIGAAASSHTHNYAGSSSAGGAANSALTCTGNSATATKLATARTISLTGSVTGSGSFDGSGNLSISTTTNHTHSYLPLGGGTMTGAVTSSLTTGTHIDGNKGKAIINATASGNGYTMLAKMNSTNGVWTLGSWNDSFNLFYTANSVVTAGTNQTTKRLSLLNESGNSSFPGTVSAPTFSGALSGNATTATTLQTARTINGTSFNGSANITTANWGTARSIGIVNSDGTGTAVTVSVNGSGNVNLKLPATIKAALTGNASTATTLATARTINGTSFNGSANITTANWGTARTITIGSTGKSVNGSGNVSWSLSEIGAAAASHTHNYVPLSGGATMTGKFMVNYLPDWNTGQATFFTNYDENTAGDGNTHIAYRDPDGASHYFRGKGGFYIHNWKGCYVEGTLWSKNNLYIAGTSETAYKSLIVGRLIDGDFVEAKYGTYHVYNARDLSSSGVTSIKRGAGMISRQSNERENVIVLTDNSLIPGWDTGLYCGISSHRFAAIHASTGTVYSSSKDEKNNITPIAIKPLDGESKSVKEIISDAIKDTNIYSYSYNTLENDDVFIGFLGQELEEQHPEFFNLIGGAYDRENGTRQYDIRESSVIGVLWSALQDALQDIDTLKKEVQELKNNQ